jgi:hypothetical protein
MSSSAGEVVILRKLLGVALCAPLLFGCTPDDSSGCVTHQGTVARADTRTRLMEDLRGLINPRTRTLRAGNLRAASSRVNILDRQSRVVGHFDVSHLQDGTWEASDVAQCTD